MSLVHAQSNTNQKRSLCMNFPYVCIAQVIRLDHRFWLSGERVVSSFLYRQRIFEFFHKSDLISYYVIMITLKFNGINVSVCCEKHIMGGLRLSEKFQR